MVGTSFVRQSTVTIETCTGGMGGGLLQHTAVVIHVEDKRMRQRRILQSKAVGHFLVPRLVFAIGRGKLATCETFSGRVEGIHHVAGDLRQLAQLVFEEHGTTGLLCTRADGHVRVFVRAPSHRFEPHVGRRSANVSGGSGKLRESTE